MTKHKRVLVIGANGTLGETFRHHYQYVAEFDFAIKHMPGGTDDIWFDLTQVDDEYAFEMLSQYDYVVNCAAITNVDKIESELECENEAFKINASCAKKLAEWCRASNTVLIHISTDFVFNAL